MFLRYLVDSPTFYTLSLHVLYNIENTRHVSPIKCENYYQPANTNDVTLQTFLFCSEHVEHQACQQSDTSNAPTDAFPTHAAAADVHRSVADRDRVLLHERRLPARRHVLRRDARLLLQLL